MAGLSLCALVALLAAVLLIDVQTYRAAPPGPARPQVQPAAAAVTLLDLVEAVAARDQQRAAALAPGDQPAAAALLGAAVANAEALGVEEFTARYVDEVGAVDTDGSWTAAVEMTWAFAGFDPSPARSEVLVGFAPEGDLVTIERIGGGDRRTPLWLREPLVVQRTGAALVLATDAAQAHQLSARVRRGIAVVQRVLPRWRPSVVVEVPASGEALDETLAAEPGTYTGIAAVTTTVDGSARPEAPTHVFVNPEVTRRLREAGAQVVISHELVHLATGAATSTVDLWLLEGFADYVALRDVDLPLTTTAARAIAQVRRDGVPRRLPGSAEFDTRAAELQAAYELAWLACEVVAEQRGEQALVRLYARATAGVPTEAALRAVGLSPSGLVRLWRERLRDLAA